MHMYVILAIKLINQAINHELSSAKISGRLSHSHNKCSGITHFVLLTGPTSKRSRYFEKSYPVSQYFALLNDKMETDLQALRKHEINVMADNNMLGYKTSNLINTNSHRMIGLLNGSGLRN